MSQELDKYRRRLAERYRNDPLIPLTLLRVGFGLLGSNRLEDYLSILGPSQQRNVISEYVASAAGGESSSSLLKRNKRLFDDLIDLQWDVECQQLSELTIELIDWIVKLVAEPERDLEGAKSWQWPASFFGVLPQDSSLRLDMALRSGDVAASELRKLSSLRNERDFFPHVRLVARVVEEHLTDLTSSASMCKGFREAFSKDFDSVRDAVIERLDECRSTASDLKHCASCTQIGRETAQQFLGFRWLDPAKNSGEDYFQKILDRHAITTGTSTNARRPAPKMIDYSGCPIARKWFSDTTPIGAGVLPAQGSTRSPKGNRA